MIISRTPLRISFVGGGSDLPAFYRAHGGAVVSAAIDKYVYVTVSKKFDKAIRVAYSKTEEVQTVDQVRHPIVRAALEHFRSAGGIEITTVADVPSHGTGMGTSSSFCVGLINAIAAYQSRFMSREELSALSCRIEIETCGSPIGKQDQYSAGYGGLNLIEFRPDESVLVSPIITTPQTRELLERRLLVFYTGTTRSANSILIEQAAATASKEGTKRSILKMVKLAYLLRDELARGHIDSFGDILHENWMLKRVLTEKVTTPEIDHWYEIGRKYGATGGKILGAGGGGFLMLYAEESRHDAITRALTPLRRMFCKFESLGSLIIFYNPSKTW